MRGKTERMCLQGTWGLCQPCCRTASASVALVKRQVTKLSPLSISEIFSIDSISSFSVHLLVSSFRSLYFYSYGEYPEHLRLIVDIILLMFEDLLLPNKYNFSNLILLSFESFPYFLSLEKLNWYTLSKYLT